MDARKWQPVPNDKLPSSRPSPRRVHHDITMIDYNAMPNPPTLLPWSNIQMPCRDLHRLSE
eukprot:scaffold42894_cov277-Skeletonema_marinoi.AAC.1